ncbi:MAG: 2-succinyl-5-enolpyruvyl-6-hydroxy-3-cyclohexene-1-carboxylate synthase [Eubacteriales bacterium]|nr:2-succinyl-5-enolpyruvyl-6-hydroxy-3-cyclohexene-1-carboxylate synthase [Eubacteriales bacterium]
MAYTSERNTQIVIELLKYHKIKKIVVSPGATNVSFVASIQNSPFFEIYSCVDERSAAYMACGLAEESGEPIALSCTGATASRNYFPGLTEAYYRKLPILAITSTMPIDRVGHNIPQMIDRTIVTNDVAKASFYIPMIYNDEDEWNCTVKVNEAILELTHNGNGPVHMNLETVQGGNFNVKEIPAVHPIDRIRFGNIYPGLTVKKIAIFVGAHSKWSDKLTLLVDTFCEEYNAIVVGDHTSNYKGKYCVPSSLITNQRNKESSIITFDVVIHIGNISGAYLQINPKSVWRVSQDGKICDTFRQLRYVFEMSEEDFFEYYVAKNGSVNLSSFEQWNKEYISLVNKIPELPFSNVWVAKKLSNKLPNNSILHLGILNSLRSWNYFKIPDNVLTYSNTGGFGIDGIISTALGSSLATNKHVFCVLGDLAFFYDMNAIGNRHLKNNLRILVLNNGHGQEFRIYGHRAAQFGQNTEKYIAAAGHYGNKSVDLIKHYAENLGFKYIAANSKEDFEEVYEDFISEEYSDKPILFEVFTNTEDETEATRIMLDLNGPEPKSVKNIMKKMLGDNRINAIKVILKG